MKNEQLISEYGKRILESKMLRELATQARNANINGDYKKLQDSVSLLVRWNRSQTDDSNGESSEREMQKRENAAFNKLKEVLLDA